MQSVPWRVAHIHPGQQEGNSHMQHAARTSSFTKVANAPYLLFTLAALLWSGNFVLARLMHADIPPVALAFWRWAGAAIIVTAMARHRLRRDWSELRRRWRIVLLLSILGIAAMNTLLYMGLQWTTVVNASLLMALMPAWIILISVMTFRDRIQKRYLVGILFSLCGACAVITGGDLFLPAGFTLNRGDLLVLLAALVFAAYSVAMRRSPAVHPLSLMSVTFTVGALILLPFVQWEMATERTISFSTATFLTLGYVMFFPSLIAYFCFNRCIELIGPVRAGFAIHLVPIFGSLIGIALLGERLEGYHVAGTVLISGGIFLTTNLAPAVRQHTHNSLEALVTRPLTPAFWSGLPAQDRIEPI